MHRNVSIVNLSLRPKSCYRRRFAGKPVGSCFQIRSTFPRFPLCFSSLTSVKSENFHHYKVPNGETGPIANFPSSSTSACYFRRSSKLRCLPTMAIAAEPPRIHVLAVDDSLTDRKLIERLLKYSSYHVTVVDSVSKALQFLGLLEDGTCVPEVDVNLVITDYCMPGMTGYDLLKKIKESSLLKDIPVVIMSSENVPSRINRCLEGGADEFFLKPVQLSDMKRLRPHIRKVDARDSGVITSTSSKGILPEWTKARFNQAAWGFLSYFFSPTCNY